MIDGDTRASPAAAARTASTSRRRPGVLEQEPGGPVADRRVDVLVVIERRHDDDRDRVVDVAAGQHAGDLEPVEPGHADVDEAHVGPRAGGPARRPLGRRCASPTTSMPWASRIRRMPERTISWSSAMTTRSRVVHGWAASGADPDRQVGGDPPAAVGERSGVEVAAHRGGPLGHPADAEPARRAADRTSVVDDEQMDDSVRHNARRCRCWWRRRSVGGRW